MCELFIGSDGARLEGFLKMFMLVRAGIPTSPRIFQKDGWCGFTWSQASVLCSRWAFTALGKLAGRLIRLARLAGEAGVGGERSTEPGQPATPGPAQQAAAQRECHEAVTSPGRHHALACS